MSSIGTSIPAIVQNQAPSKGKAGLAATAGGASDGQGFASAIASVSGRDGEGERKGGRISISAGKDASADPAEQAGDGRAKVSRRALPTFAGTINAGSGQGEAEGGDPMDAAAAFLEAMPGRTRTQHAERRGTAEGEEPAIGKGEDEVAAADETTEAGVGREVSSLLDMLTAPDAVAKENPDVPAAGLAAQFAAAGGAREQATRVDGKAAGKTDARAEVATRLANAEAAAGDGAADAGDLPGSEADQLFRLVRSDGKGREIDMSISARGDRATFRDANANGPRGEAVAVVDSRRYIGLAQTGNAAAVTTAITQDPEWASSLRTTGGLTHSEAAVTGRVVNTLKIQMNPIELGMVTATLRLAGDELVVSLQVETREAYRQLSDDQDAIVKALRGQGFAVDQVTVQLSPADRSASAQQQGDGQAQQFSGQPQAREGGGEGRQNGEQRESGNFEREGSAHEGRMAENGTGVAGTQPLRAGSLYV